jgi:hypothetical protein
MLAAKRQNPDPLTRARQDASMLPSGRALDKILRYETLLERQMFPRHGPARKTPIPPPPKRRISSEFAFIGAFAVRSYPNFICLTVDFRRQWFLILFRILK